jgi:uncharacterized protein YbjT (DUF2867 family)
MIVVTGATGKLGSAVIENLLKHLDASEVIASVRKPEEAEKLVEQGVHVRRGDYDDPSSLFHSFVGAQRLLLISSTGIDHEKRSARHRNAIEAAVRAKVGHIYYTSLLPGNDSISFVMKAHLDTEANLKAYGLPFTILKNGVYAEAWNLYLGDVLGGEVVVPDDGPISWVSQTDLAEGIARLLIDGGHTDETLNLTGPAGLDLRDVAKILSRIRGKPITLRIVSVEDYVAHLAAAGKSEEFARHWATTYFGMAREEWGKVDPSLGNILGRPLRKFEDVARNGGPLQPIPAAIAP